MKKIVVLIFVVFFVSITSLSAIAQNERSNVTEITIAAAASLQNVYNREIIPLFRHKHPEIIVKGIFDSSGRLETQILSGLPVDIFTPAALTQMNSLVEKGFVVRESVKPLLRNRIVLIKTAEIDSPVTDFENIILSDFIAIGNPAFVPAGEYARVIFTRLGIWEEVFSKASLGTNVTEVLSWVSEGSAEVGVVYKSDACSTNKVDIVSIFPEDIIAIYPIGIISSSRRKREAQIFIDFLSSEESLMIFRNYGFE